MHRPTIEVHGLGGARVRKSSLHVPRERLPAALAQLHRALRPGSALRLTLLAGGDRPSPPEGDVPGRSLAGWDRDRLVDVVIGAGFGVSRVEVRGADLVVEATRERTLPDVVDDRMRILVCGLNPSLHAADAGVGYAGPGNRFWPAAVEAGLVERPGDPWHALARGVGMTDLCKRATPGAGELSAAEYREGAARVERLVGWLRPTAVCFVGLAGYRAAVDRGAVVGLQARPFGGAVAYVMASTSGRNARTTYRDLVEHLRAVSEVAEAGS